MMTLFFLVTGERDRETLVGAIALDAVTFAIGVLIGIAVIR